MCEKKLLHYTTVHITQISKRDGDLQLVYLWIRERVMETMALAEELEA